MVFEPMLKHSGLFANMHTYMLSTAGSKVERREFPDILKALEYAGVWDKGGASWNSLSPSAGLRFTLLEGVDLVAFGRRAYRTPTFNELYYPGYGNPALKPEDAYLAD